MMNEVSPQLFSDEVNNEASPESNYDEVVKSEDEDFEIPAFLRKNKNFNSKVDERYFIVKNLFHYPVMLKEVINICDVKKGGLFIDCTYGAGGYTNAILSYPNTKVIALDRDPNIKSLAEKTKKNYKNRFFFHNSKFSELNKILSKNTEADCIIFDLGLSSLQLFDLKRGFSFYSKEEPDMRMGLNENSAKDVLNNLDANTLKIYLNY